MSAQRSRYRRRGLRCLLWAGLGCIVVQLGFSLLLDSWWLGLRFPQLTAVVADAERQARSPEVVCLGSSRLGVAFRPNEITQTSARHAFNACIEAGDPLTSEFMLNRLLERNIRPEIVIVEVSPETLAEKNAWMHLHVSRQIRWLDVPEVLTDVWRSRNLPRLAAARLVPLHTYRRELGAKVELSRTPWKSKQKRRPTQEEQLPFVDTLRITAQNEKDLPPWEKRLIWVPLVCGWLQDYRLGGAAERALERIVTRCRQEQIEVILVGAPVSSPHRALYTPAIESEFQACMARLTSQRGCRFLDWRDRFADELFVDNHHLFREGALAFSADLVNELDHQPVAQARERWRNPR
jgi:hypothetical protein